MTWNEEKQKWENLTEEEQKLADMMFNKGFSQAKKAPTAPSANTAPAVEEPKTNTNIDLEAITQLIQSSVSQVIAPIQTEFTNIKTAQQETLKQSVIAKQTTKLPNTYLALVTGATEQEITASYQRVTEQYQNELKALGITSSFGAPTPNPTPTPTNQKKFSQMSPAEKIELCKSDPQLYTRLKNQK